MNIERSRKIVCVGLALVIVSIAALLTPAPSVSAIPVSTSDAPITENISEALENVGCLSGIMVLGGGLLGLTLIAKRNGE